MLRFPDGFLWGTATASYQIEGAVNEDGRGETIWDRFCRTPGKVFNGDTGDVACEHYHRWKEDVALMKRLSLRGYRFSVAWSRVFPEGKGKLNRPGLDFYSRLVDELLDAGITPAVTLYHWDLPQSLQDAGGWENRDTADYFVEYANAVFQALGDRVGFWITHNEPFVVAFSGNSEGRHAPGKTDFATAVRVSHALLASHARVVRLFRSDFAGSGRIGITLNLRPCYPREDADEDATRRADGYLNRWFLDPVFRGWYPPDMLDHYRAKGVLVGVDESDRDLISSAKVDFVGVNFYTRALVHRSTVQQPLEFERSVPKGAQVTETGWEIYPEGLYHLLTRIDRDYGRPDIYITEGGAAFRDETATAGIVEDGDRIDYLRRHFEQAHRAIGAGVRLKGYFLWTLMDNFEWEHGYSKLFGIVKTDYSTQARTPKRSAFWYQRVVQANAIPED
jgi:beta-glucosidase